MTSRECVKQAIAFKGPAWLPHDFPGAWGTDFAFTAMTPSPDARRTTGRDEWGAVWDNLGPNNVGEVKDYPLTKWDDFERMPIPDIHDPNRWSLMPEARANAGDKFLIGFGISLYERTHFLRGMENIWMDILDEPERISRLIDILVEMNLVAIKRFAAAGVDGFFWPDDWGLQNRLMIAPEAWRQIWKPRYARVYEAAHDAGLLTFLHSCGYIVDILDDLIDIGLDVIHMDQQENMGLDVLGKRFGGRLTFFSPVDIQTAMNGPLDEVRAYTRRMVKALACPEGGFIARWYTDPKGAGHTQAALDVMCEEFLKISREMYGT